MFSSTVSILVACIQQIYAETSIEKVYITTQHRDINREYSFYIDYNTPFSREHSTQPSCCLQNSRPPQRAYRETTIKFTQISCSKRRCQISKNQRYRETEKRAYALVCLYYSLRMMLSSLYEHKVGELWGCLFGYSGKCRCAILESYIYIYMGCV